MICTTIQNRTAGQIVEALEHCGMAEIRLDRCSLSAKEIEDVFTSDVPLMATCRISEVIASEPSLQDPSLTDQSREVKAMQIAERRLIKAVEAGARYVEGWKMPPPPSSPGSCAPSRSPPVFFSTDREWRPSAPGCSRIPCAPI